MQDRDTGGRLSALGWLNKLLLAVSCVALMLVVTLAVANMLLRPLGHPITGSYELMGFGSALAMALGLGYSQEKKAHIAVDILFRHLPTACKRWLSLIGHGICGVFFSAVAWKMFLLSKGYRASGELSETLKIPFYPVITLVALGIAVLALNLFFSAIGDHTGNKPGSARGQSKTSSRSKV